MLNRAQRRAKPQKKAETLREWLSKPDLIVRRGEMWEVIMKAIEIHRLDQKRNRPWWRFTRWMTGQGEKKPKQEKSDG